MLVLQLEQFFCVTHKTTTIIISHKKIIVHEIVQVLTVVRLEYVPIYTFE